MAPSLIVLEKLRKVYTRGRLVRRPTFTLEADLVIDRPGIVGVVDEEISFALVLEDAGLGGHVGGLRPMPVEVVGSDVGDHRRLRMEAVHKTQLEAGHFHRHGAAAVAGSGQMGERETDVTAGGGLDSALVEHCRHQFGNRRLAVRARHSCHRKVEVLPAEFDLAPEGDASLQRLHHREASLRESRAGHYQIDPLQEIGAPLTGDNGEALLQQADSPPHLLVEDRRRMPQATGQAGGGGPRDGCTENQDPHCTPSGTKPERKSA